LARAVSLGIDLGVSLGKQLGRRLGDPALQLLKLYALTGFSATSFYQTQSGGGEAGVSTGFGSMDVYRCTSVAAVVRYLRSKLGTNAGWQHLLYTNGLGANYGTGAAYPDSPRAALVASDLSRIFAVLSFYDPGTSLIRLWLNRHYLGAVGQASYSPATLAQVLGAQNASGALPATGVDWLGGLSFRGVPTDAQVLALFDATRALLDLPKTIDGGTVTHRWSLKDQLLGVPNPAGRKSYGARGFSAANRMRTNQPRAFGHTSGFTFAWRHRIDTQSLASGTRQAFAAFQSGPNRGLQVLVGGANATLAPRLFDAAGNIVDAPAYSILAGDVGQVLTCLAYYDPATSRHEFYVNNVRMGTGTAMPSMGIATIDLGIGADTGGGLPCDGSTILAWEYGNGAPPTQAQRDAFFEACYASGQLAQLPQAEHLHDITRDTTGTTLPATIADRIGTDHVSVVGTLELGVYTESGPVAPAKLTDTITQASVDELERKGLARVVTIDPAIDGRSTKGALGFGNAAFLEHPTTMRGAVAFNVEAEFEISSAGANTIRGIAGCRDSGQPGWMLVTAGTNTSLQFAASSAAGPSSIATIALTAADYGVRLRAVAFFVGNIAYLLLRRPSGDTLAQGSATGVFAQYAGPFRVGARADGYPADNLSIYSVAGGHNAITLADAQTILDTAAAKGSLQQHAAMEHLWDFTQDIAANNGELPAVFLDRIGTDHLARIDIDVPKVGPNGIRGVGPYTLLDQWRSSAGGGIQGQNAGFHVCIDLVLSKVPTANETVASSVNPTGFNGWYIAISSSGQLRFVCTGVAASSSYALTSGDLNKRLRILAIKTAAVVQFYVLGSQVGSDVAAVSYAVPGGWMAVGSFNGTSEVFGSGWVELVQGGDTLLSAPEIAALFADLTQPPPLTAGQKRWRFHDDSAAAPTKTPRTSVERVSGADADKLTRYGAGLQIAQRTERLFSYETTPIMKAGASSGAGANRWQGAASMETAGSASGFFVGLLTRPRSTTAGRIASNSGGGPQGWNIVGNAGVQLQFNAVDASGTNRQAPLIVVSADSKARAALWTFDAPASLLRAYHNRAHVGSGTSMTGYSMSGLSGLGLTLGALFGGGSPQPDWDTIGLVYGLGVPTLAQFQAWEDATMAFEDIVALEGATHMYSFKSGLQGTTLLDLIGSYDVPAVGAPVVTDIYTRAWAR
jgi:hypothetical protein